MNINEMSLIELKALAYDQLILLEQTQNNIGLINKEIKKKLELLESEKVS